MSTAPVASFTLRQQHTDDTRRRILDAALALMGEQPETSFSHEEIAMRSGIARRTVYRHFPSRAELLDAVWQEGNRRLDLAH